MHDVGAVLAWLSKWIEKRGDPTYGKGRTPTGEKEGREAENRDEREKAMG